MWGIVCWAAAVCYGVVEMIQVIDFDVGLTGAFVVLCLCGMVAVLVIRFFSGNRW